MPTVNTPIAPSYQTIRRSYQTHSPIEEVIVDHYAKLLSPFFTQIFVRARIIPNVVTVLMMASGILAAGLFALPWLATKIGGTILIHLWYVLDCSDGEVARITKRFSRMGAEIDYTAHLVCHPLFNLAFAWSLISLHRYNTTMILIVSIVSISAELMLRNIISLRSIYELKIGTPVPVQNSVGRLTRTRQIIMQAFYLYPNTALVFPILFILDYSLGTSLSLYCLFAQSSISALAVLWSYVGWVRKILWT